MERKMKTGRLLEMLISIAQISKTDFALNLNMTPSGLSKILTGKRLPYFKEKRAFCINAARCLCEALYARGCYLKLEPVFPVLYDFSSKQELEVFLSAALNYCLSYDFALENNTFDYSDRELCYLGKKNILNMLCVIASDCVREASSPLEFYGSLPLFDERYDDIFQKVRLSDAAFIKNAAFNFFVGKEALDRACEQSFANVLNAIVKAQESLDLILWSTEGLDGQPFLLLKGQFLLLFNLQLDGMHMLTHVSHRGYLSMFYNALMQKPVNKMSYGKSEALEALRERPAFLSELAQRGIEAVYNFVSIGYMLKKEEISAGFPALDEGAAGMVSLLHSALSPNTAFYVTLDAMVRFFSTGKAIVPFIGTLDLPQHERAPYLKRLDGFIGETSVANIKFLNTEEFSQTAVLCARGLSLVYTIDPSRGYEKAHLLRTDAVPDALRRELAENALVFMDFNADLWDTYLEGLALLAGR